MKRFFLVSLGISFSILLGAFFGVSSASAVSDYDDNFSVAENLKIVPYGENVTTPCDLSGSWAGIFLNDETPQDVKDLWVNREGWSVSRQLGNTSTQLNGERFYGRIDISFWVTGDTMPSASWSTASAYQDSTWLNVHSLSFRVDTDCSANWVRGDDLKTNEVFWLYDNSQGKSTIEPFLTYNMDVNYPVDYEGEIVPDTYTPPEDPEIIYPQYNWTVSKDENDNGILTVKYQDNLPHFLTGTSTLEVIEFTEQWEEIDESLGLLPATPAGWADWQFNIGQGQGWYMFRITHSQQLDVPPWGEDDNYYIGDVLYQFYWDGQTFLNGTTVGCDGIVCNEFEFPDGERVENTILGSLKVDTFGLSSLITAPLNFFSQLPNKLDNCTPITFPFHFGDVTVPCLTPAYKDNLGSLFTLYQTVLVGLFTYFLGLRIFGNIKDISNPKDSSIEVVKL